MNFFDIIRKELPEATINKENQSLDYTNVRIVCTADAIYVTRYHLGHTGPLKQSKSDIKIVRNGETELHIQTIKLEYTDPQLLTKLKEITNGQRPL